MDDYWLAPAAGFSSRVLAERTANGRLLEPIGNILPAEAEDRYYAMLVLPARAA